MRGPTERRRSTATSTFWCDRFTNFCDFNSLIEIPSIESEVAISAYFTVKRYNRAPILSEKFNIPKLTHVIGFGGGWNPVSQIVNCDPDLRHWSAGKWRCRPNITERFSAWSRKHFYAPDDPLTGYIGPWTHELHTDDQYFCRSPCTSENKVEKTRN